MWPRLTSRVLPHALYHVPWGILILICSLSLSLQDKDKWIGVERVRWARFFNIPMTETMPEGFPPLTLGIMRALCALTVLRPGKEGQGVLCACLDELYKAFWVEHKKTSEADVLKGVLVGVLGEEETEKGNLFSTRFALSEFRTK